MKTVVEVLIIVIVFLYLQHFIRKTEGSYEGMNSIPVSMHGILFYTFSVQFCRTKCAEQLYL